METVMSSPERERYLSLLSLLSIKKTMLQYIEDVP
jgi:hypothetical protein